MNILIQIVPDVSDTRGFVQQQISALIVYLRRVTRMCPDIRLPFNRVLSEQLMLSSHTVNGVYKKIFTPGYIQFKPDSGANVSQNSHVEIIDIKKVLKKHHRSQPNVLQGNRWRRAKL